MTMIPADTRALRCPHASFNPVGKLTAFGRPLATNPEQWSTTETWAARLFVGLSVRDPKTGKVTPRFEMTDVVEFVKVFRAEQGADPDSSYIAQAGVFTHRPPEGGKKVIDENSVQVIIFHTGDEPVEEFRKQMMALADALAVEFEQESVIVEIQRNGVSQYVGSFGPV